MADPANNSSGILTKLISLLACTWNRVGDGLRTGLDMRGLALRVSGRIFDEGWYIEEHPDVAGYNGTMAQHFFRHGIYEGRRARFFDARWYYRAHGDLRFSLVDAWTHYRAFGASEGRAARFIYIDSEILRSRPRGYQEWIDLYDKTEENALRSLREAYAEHPLDIAFSLLAVPQTTEDPLQAAKAIETILYQLHDRFEVLIGLTPNLPLTLVRSIRKAVNQDSRVRFIEVGASDEAVAVLLAETINDHVMVLNVTDRLHPAALFWLARAIQETPAAQVFYGDEDRLDAQGKRGDPYFKTQLNYELLLSHDMIGYPVVYSRGLLRQLAGHDASSGTAASHDLALRAFEKEGGQAFRHVPHVLAHVQTVPPLEADTLGVVRSHFARTGKRAEVSGAPGAPGYARVRHALPHTKPLVSILIPTRDRIELVKVCISSLFERTTWRNFEIILVDNGSVEPESFAYFESLIEKGVRILRDDRPFNYSALNNAAAAQARGEYICLMNNDIEIITPDWLEEMMAFAVQPDVGCVGARLWYPDGTIQHAGVLLGFHGVAGHMHKHLSKEEGGYRERSRLHQQLSAVTAAVLLVRKSTYEAVGGLDETLAVAFNDVDFCLKVRDAGYRNIYTPYAEMIHYESASRGADITLEQRAREAREIKFMLDKYGDSLMCDPAYNPNLSLVLEDLSAAFPPRAPLLSDVLKK